MLLLRRAWVLAALLLVSTAITVHCLDHTQPASSASQHVPVSGLGYYSARSLELVEKVRLYAFSGLGDDVKPSQWPELRPGWRVVSAVILAMLGASICSAGGIGGGGLFIPIFNLLLQFDAKTSAALSNFVILGGSIANLIWNLPQRHPLLPHKPMINYDVALILQPNMLLGISLGVICNVMFPGWLIILQLAVILGYITTRSWKNGLKRWRVESHLAAVNESALSGDMVERGEEGDAKKNLLRAISDEEAEAESEEPLGLDLDSKIRDESNDLTAPLLTPVRESSESGCYLSKILSLALVWLAFFGIQLLRGSKTTEGILPLESCGFGYWLLTATQIPLACLVTVWTALRHPKRCSSEEQGEDTQDEGDVTRSRALTLFPAMALGAGLLGGMLGIGGGMVMNPLLIEIGMHPQVTAATTAFMVFFSSSLSVVEFWLLGRIPMDFALFFSALCFFSSLVGLSVVHHAISKYGRASIIVFSVAIVMGISATMMAGFGTVHIYQEYLDGAYMGFHTPCG
ncbi:hypothetical protein KC19_1G060700 [Ceratodon purpureus]|uniref:Sulfite exporter TauE/SafE family protein n=1 Tax=Ceratodon purpureus TaxID=3225 RepID=A0A8T0J5A6_CERPU|nr:hypothetical protein KC19_1G060700 [Ceratodon purpureus]